MAWYEVELHIEGWLSIQVEAESKEGAVRAAIRDCTVDNVFEFKISNYKRAVVNLVDMEGEEAE